MRLSIGKKRGLRKMADANGYFKMASLDQRPPIEDPIKAYLGTTDVPFDDIVKFKRLLIDVFQDASTALLLDPVFAVPGCLDDLRPDRGLFISIEDPFPKISGRNTRLSAPIKDWTIGKIKRLGGDAVKLLIWYRPDADYSTLRHQKHLVKEIGGACGKYDIPFFLELLSYPLEGESTKQISREENAKLLSTTVFESVEAFSDPVYGVDVFMLESPISGRDITRLDGLSSSYPQDLFDKLGALTNRPWVMLSMGADMLEFHRIMTYAYNAGACGYLAGRAYWQDTLSDFPDWQKMRADLKHGSCPHIERLNTLTDTEASSWSEHACWTTEKSNEENLFFCQTYQDI